jgi:hypothetical protein
MYRLDMLATMVAIANMAELTPVLGKKNGEREMDKTSHLRAWLLDNRGVKHSYRRG